MGYESNWLPPLQNAGGAHQRSDRLDGWKSVAAYFGRDRTTVIRWARERALPVYRLPGGKTATIYALKSELAAWAQARDGLAVAGDADQSPSAAATSLAAPQITAGKWQTQNWRQWTLGIASAALAIGATATAAFQIDPTAKVGAHKAAVLALPSDPDVARKFLTARDLTADRDALTLEQAIMLLEQVVAAAPRFAAGQSSLAEALLLSREFGMREDAAAFPRARTAARAAVRLAPEMASGHRMLGFIAYWADQDFAEANAAFKNAIALAPDDALSHFWYGNVLSDHGDHGAALKMLNHARLLQPGSVAIQTDLAWVQWSAGEEVASLKDLQDIAERNPGFAVVHDCLASIALARGDLPDYVKHFTRYAMLRRDDRLMRRADALELGLHGGRDVLRREVLLQANADAEPKRTFVIPALLASVAGDRAQLKTILQKAEDSGESWGDSGFLLRISRTWAADREISGLISLRRDKRRS